MRTLGYFSKIFRKKLKMTFIHQLCVICQNSPLELIFDVVTKFDTEMSSIKEKIENDGHLVGWS